MLSRILSSATSSSPDNTSKDSKGSISVSLSEQNNQPSTASASASLPPSSSASFSVGGGETASAALHSFYDLPPQSTNNTGDSTQTSTSSTPQHTPSASSQINPATAATTNDVQAKDSPASSNASSSVSPPSSTTSTSASSTSPPSRSAPSASASSPTTTSSSDTITSPIAVSAPAVPSLTPEQMKVAEIMDRFAEWHTDLTKNPHRILIKEGKLSRQATFKTVDRTVYLFNDCFLITDVVTKGEHTGKLIQKQLIDLRAVVVEDGTNTTSGTMKKNSSNNNSFILLTPERDFVFIAPNVTTKQDWMSKIRDAASQHKLTASASHSIVDDSNSVGIAGKQVFGASNVDDSTDDRLLSTTLHSCVADGNDDILLHLLSERGEDPNQRNPEGTTALHLAILYGNAFAVSLLIAHGADLSLTDRDGNTPVHLACKHADFGTVMVLLSKGADVKMKDGEGKSPLWVLTENVKDELLLVEDSSKQADDSKQENDTQRKPSVDDSSSSTSSSSSSLVEQREYHLKSLTDMVTMMVDAGAEVEEEHNGLSLLSHLCQKGKWSSVIALCENHVNVSVVDPHNGRTVLHTIALLAKTNDPISLQAHLRSARAVLTHGLGPNIRDYTMNTPLHLCSALALATCLLVNGARGELKNNDNHRALEYFESKAHYINDSEYLYAMDAIRDARDGWIARPDTVLEQGGMMSDEQDWTNDDALEQCMLCAQSFTLTRRRHHCRRCGALIDKDCASKSFRLNSSSHSNSSEEESYRCCDSCYNLMVEKELQAKKVAREVAKKEREKKASLAANEAKKSSSSMSSSKDRIDSKLERADAAYANRMKESEARIKAIQDRTNHRQELFEEKKRRDAAIANNGELNATMNNNRSMLEERGQRLNEMADKSSRLQDDAQNFYEMARKLKEKEQSKSSWFPF